MLLSKSGDRFAGLCFVVFVMVVFGVSGCAPEDQNPVFANAELVGDFSEKLYIVVSVEESLTEGFNVKRVVLLDTLDNSLISALTTNEEVWMHQKVQITQLNYIMFNDSAPDGESINREATIFVFK